MPTEALPEPEAQPQTKEAFGDDKAGGKPLDKILGVPRRSCSVPGNVYGCSMMAGVMFDFQAMEDWLLLAFQAYCRLGFNYLLQTLLLVALHQLNKWQSDTIDSGDCYRLMGWFYFICHMLFFFVVLLEFEETWTMLEIMIFHIPLVQGPSSVLLFEDDGAGGAGAIVSGGMNMARKVTLFLFVIVPKGCIAVGMLVIGAQFLSTAGSNTDLLLNALAATFVLDVDEQIYVLLAPGRIRETLEGMPSFEAPQVKFIGRIETLTKLGIPLALCAIWWTQTTRCERHPCDWEFASQPCPVWDPF
mmetsp:Transcript_106785/g.189791  ORF Transcript_106785/g.189791 Transcript_106785/m.189791 type:complete len:302 (+) Transcript_106785:53-958(+)